MAKAVEIDRTRTQLALAMEVVHHDRWILGGVQDGRLRVIAQTDKPILADANQTTGRSTTPTAGSKAAIRPLYVELSQMARRCLYERHPIALTSVVEPGAEDGDWEMDWPALVYAPVGLPNTRPLGILIVGSRSEHWYTQDEIDFLAALAVTLTAAVSCVVGRLGRLSPRERRVAILLAEGFSDLEVARALGLDPMVAGRVVDDVLRKLAVRTRREVREMVPALMAASAPRLL